MRLKMIAHDACWYSTTRRRKIIPKQIPSRAMATYADTTLIETALRAARASLRHAAHKGRLRWLVKPQKDADTAIITSRALISLRYTADSYFNTIQHVITKCLTEDYIIHYMIATWLIRLQYIISWWWMMMLYYAFIFCNRSMLDYHHSYYLFSLITCFPTPRHWLAIMMLDT